MKFKKGSAAAKTFMAKLRAARGKKKVNGSKKLKPVYVNVLGQRVKVGTKLYDKLMYQKKHFNDLQKYETNRSIGAAGDYAKYELSTIKALAKLIKKPLNQTQKLVNNTPAALDLISRGFDNKQTPAHTAKDIKAYLIPVKQKTPLDAFVNLLSKKSKPTQQGKASFPMRLPAQVTIGNINSSLKSPFKTMADVRAANAKNGFMFFSPKTMKFFGSKIVTPLLMGRYFITSEKQRYSSGETETTYTIRKAEDNGKIETIWKTGSINHFKTKEEAKQYLKKLY